MSPTRLLEIRKRLERVMDGPWAIGQEKTGEWFVEKTNDYGEEQAWIASCGRCGGEETADFIAHARMDLPDVIDRIEHLEAALRAVMDRKGPYSQNPLKHAENTILAMADLARRGLEGEDLV